MNIPDWMIVGVTGWPLWAVIVSTLVMTHVTIAAVTIYLHRSQAHRALTLSPVPSHFFRFWLWLTTGMKTKDWVAIHRKHHAKCETDEDPHSPQTRGIKTVFWRGSELYRAEAKVQATLDTYGHNTPNDWIERHLYSRFTWHGVALMLIINLTLFGVLGLTVWAVQMAWIPVTAAGIINGLGHWWGYRSFDSPDNATNLSRFGFIIGGEELHNNHHTYPTSAKLSVQPEEFDVGWLYIRVLEWFGVATVRRDRLAPQAEMVGQAASPEEMLETVIALRYVVLQQFDSITEQSVCKIVDCASLRASLVAVWTESEPTSGHRSKQAVLAALESWRQQLWETHVFAFQELSERLPYLRVVRH
jgi:stearoyl-CoA desaturase (Delta-9 desaturase)